ncbi:copper chaperone PCu(A)C [Meridianimarinicoccus sp. MJW13]|uniref:copper chaperone PCu(A)C n=1 Tax=Meridianimarinicoccus sp. MJW13 TaxID=2720031 RepID=UPI0018696A56|nr:copper chaperone PCu(A)C [Fluviibacterium sp. MJW13]
MTSRFSLLAAAMTAGLAFASAAAADIIVTDAYARSAGKAAKSGAAFLVIENTGAEDDRLVAAAAPVAHRVELHTHKEADNGVMQMIHVEEGFPVPAGGKHMLMRGGDHVMFMGLTQPMEPGATFPLTLTFEKAGEMTVDVVVDLDRKPGEGGHGMHQAGHGDMSGKGMKAGSGN